MSYHGDYDEVFYDVDSEAKNIILSNSGVIAGGCYKNLGYIGDENKEYAVACFDNPRDSMKDISTAISPGSTG